MSEFTDTVKVETPRLVVEYQCVAPGNEGFQWGIVHAERMPVLKLIGYVGQLQEKLSFDLSEEALPERLKCDQPALVVAWADDHFQYFVHPSIPLLSLLGMLELVKAVLVASKLAPPPNAKRSSILGPDGSPVPR